VSIELAALTNAKAEEGEWLAIAGDFRIKVKGVDSDTYRRALHANAQQRYKSGALEDVSYDMLVGEQVAVVTACTVEWEGLTENGVPLPCNATNADRLYRSAPAVVRKVMAHWGEQQSFTLPSVTESSPTPAITLVSADELVTVP
jgi:hypothetical protein